MSRKAWLNLNIFTMKFGKIKCPTTEHMLKVVEEFKELQEAYTKYQYLKLDSDDMVSTKGSLAREKLCDEALDLAQSSISFISHLIDTEEMTANDLKAWFKKIQQRKKKYLKRGVEDGKEY